MHCIFLVLAIAANPIIDSECAPRSLQTHAFNAMFRVDQHGAGTGSGFAIHCRPLQDGKYAVSIVTAYHCVDADGAITVHSVRTHPAPDYAGSFAARILASDSSGDIAVLEAITDREISCLRIASFDGETRNSPPSSAITIGCSNGDFPTIWDVATLGTDSNTTLAGSPWVVAGNAIPGRSGGPLISADFESPNFGRVLGVCCLNKEERCYFADTHRVRRCLRNAGVPLDPATMPGDALFPSGFTIAALRVLIVTILCSFIRL